MQVNIQAAYLNKSCVGAGDKKLSGPFHRDVGGCGGSQSTVPELYKFGAAWIPRLGIREDFFRLHVQESQPHGAAPAAAESLLRIEADHGVPTFPNSGSPGIAPVANAVSQVPDPYKLIQLASRCGNSGGNHVRIIEDAQRGNEVSILKGNRERFFQLETLGLRQIRRFLDDSFPDDSGKAYPDGVNALFLKERLNLVEDALADALRRHTVQEICRTAGFRIKVD